jgi:hypothetical protein
MTERLGEWVAANVQPREFNQIVSAVKGGRQDRGSRYLAMLIPVNKRSIVTKVGHRHVLIGARLGAPLGLT